MRGVIVVEVSDQLLGVPRRNHYGGQQLLMDTRRGSVLLDLEGR